MESVTIRLDAGLAKEMRKAMKNKYSTKTEFIREAIRNQITEAEKEQALRNLEKYYGFLKHKKTPLDEDERIREKVGREYARRHGIKLE